MAKEISRIERRTAILGPVKAAYHENVRKLCLRPYFDHPKGCPNYGRRSDCPPQANRFLEVFEDSVYVAAVIFNFEDYLNLKRAEHPDWTERALRNPRHWQGHLRSELKKFVSEKLANNSDYGDTAILNPEAMGINVTQTCKSVGLLLEWPPQKIVCRVALIAQKR